MPPVGPWLFGSLDPPSRLDEDDAEVVRARGDGRQLGLGEAVALALGHE